MFKRHMSMGDSITHHVSKHPPYGRQADALRQDPSQVMILFQIDENLLKKIPRLLIRNSGNDPSGIYNAVYGAQSIQGALYIGFHVAVFLHPIPNRFQSGDGAEQGMPRGGKVDQSARHHPVAQPRRLGR